MAGFSATVGNAVGGPMPGIGPQSTMIDRRAGLTKAEALHRGVAMAHRGIVYVHMDLRNHDIPPNKATVRR